MVDKLPPPDYYPPIMASDRVQRQIDSLLDEAEAAIKELDWRVVHDRAEAVLAIDPENPDGLTYLATAERAMGGAAPAQTGHPAISTPTSTSAAKPDHPTSFSNGRNEVSSSEQRLAYNFDATFPFSVKHPLHFRAVFNFWPDLTPGA